MYLQRELKLSIPAVQGYRSAFKLVFSLADTDLTAKSYGRMFSSFEKTCPPMEVKPPEWNLSLVLSSLACAICACKLSSNNHLYCRACFLLALALTKRVCELNGLSYQIVGQSRLRHVKSGRLVLLLCSSGGILQFRKQWRLIPGCPRPPF